MPREHVSMRKIREVLRLKLGQNMSRRAVAVSCNIGVTTVHEYLRRFEAAGLSWPLPDDLSDADLESLLFPVPPSGEHPQPDFAAISHELRKKGVTLTLLWEEYRQQNGGGYGRSQFSELYRRYAAKLDPRMRQTHKAGEKLFVDYAGMTVDIVDPSTGEIQAAQVFVATLGASDYTFVEATWSQSLQDWIGSHVRAFEYFGGIPEILVPDNLKSGVTSPCYYEPDINPSYQELADYYNIAVLPARVRRPRDKAKVENHVLNVERRILAPLRNRRFMSLGECNRAIAELLTTLNNRPFQQMPGSRRELFVELDLPALRPLPQQPYSFGLWKKVRVSIDYHIQVDRSFYSVPYTLLKEQVDARLSERIVEIFHKGQRIASHPRSFRPGSYTTVTAHMPLAHQVYQEWTPQRLVRWAEQTGGATATVIETIMAAKSHPQQGFRSCLGIMNLTKTFGADRLEAACGRAIAIGATSYKSIRNILDNKLDQAPIPSSQTSKPTPIIHHNIRGAGYYQSAFTLDFNETKGN